MSEDIYTQHACVSEDIYTHHTRVSVLDGVVGTYIHLVHDNTNIFYTRTQALDT
jgi:hypothetical protein